MYNQYYYELLNNGLRALNFGSRKEQEHRLNEIWGRCTSEERNEVYNEIQKTQIYPNNFITYDTKMLSDDDIRLNLRFYCNKLLQKIQEEQGNKHTVSFNAINFLFPNSIYLGTDILYQNNSDTLDVSKLLDAIGYGLSIAGLIFNVDTEEYESYITVLKGLERFFNNDKPQNPLKDLSYALEVFYKIQNYFETNPEKKREKKIESLVVSLFIEFLTK